MRSEISRYTRTADASIGFLMENTLLRLVYGYVKDITNACYYVDCASLECKKKLADIVFDDLYLILINENTLPFINSF